MEVDSADEGNEFTNGTKENGLAPVLPNTYGEGFPYAPVDWPMPGDVWGWKVGKRTSLSGFFLDRNLYLPRSLQQGGQMKRSFSSKLSVERYLKEAFPSADLDAFFASFSWKIPSERLTREQMILIGFDEGQMSLTMPPEETSEDSASGSLYGGACCKAGNKTCCSLTIEERNPPATVMPCDVCCSEPGFCRDCCCILCCKTVDSSLGGYSFIKCKAAATEGYICGHVAHLDCALRSYMAGTFGGTIGLDAEYYCRRCDARTDLISHVAELLKTCESINMQENVEKILNAGLCILRNSQKPGARSLQDRIGFVIEKLKPQNSLDGVWKEEDNISATPTVEITSCQEAVDCGMQEDLSTNVDHRSASQKLDEVIDRVLHRLRKSQETEYQIAEERLSAQRNYILNLYQQVEMERSELARNPSDAMRNAVLNRVEQIKREAKKLKDMRIICRGFGRTPKTVLREHFCLDVQD
ncbi:Oberon, PHD finger domain [Dillenia turbinata]|uniref:Oberon, PHD finger domain n=1 Tax=Dillenia turbinata TaxID=194707 RepID=A0AAN8UMH4_9MAGN